MSYPYAGTSAHPTYGYQRLPRDKKAERFEAKAVEWERRGNTLKAQKNRDKALRHRQRLQPGYVPIAHAQPYYVDKANRLDQRALRYQQMGLTAQAQRHQQRALRTRTKHGITGSTLPTGTSGLAGLSNQQYGNTGAYIGPITPVGMVYKGLNYPMTGSTQHPTFGYSKLTSSQKAQRFDAKAAEWEKRGDLLKAQKNREKANRYRQMNQAGYVKPTRAQNYYIDRASHFDQKAIRAQQMGRSQQALRSQQRAQRIRAKHNIPAGTAMGAGALGAAGLAGNRSMGQYQGLNFPYTGASNHPTYGYQRLSRDQKIQRFEAKAAEWQKRGNMTKAQKNRDKANRYRMMSQPGYVKPARAQNYYPDRANLFDQKAARYQQLGMMPQAQRYQGRSQRIRAKHNIPAAAGLAGAGLGSGLANNNNRGLYNNNNRYHGQYQGLNFPYTGATAHPTYGYQRLPREQKIQRLEAKAAEWEKRGNMNKAQKNRMKANQYRQMSQPGYVRPQRPQNYYTDRANLFDQKAARYQQWGMMPQAQRYQGRAQRIRAKHNLTGFGGHQNFAGHTWTTGQRQVGPIVPAGITYSGLNFPYTGAAAHPSYGYMRLPHNKKAERFELKAAEWERRGNLRKAQKNREKANRYRARSQPGYVAQTRPQSYYVDRANLFDQKASQYQQWGMLPQAQRYQGRSQRIRTKRGIPLTSAAVPVTTGATAMPTTGFSAPLNKNYTTTTGMPTTTAMPTTYSGLNFPYTGATAHPQYGYQRLPRDRKAERFELKAAEWERRGNMKKATKNREKALRIRQKTQPGYVSPVRPADYYTNRANLFDQKAYQYQQWGMQPQATRYNQRASAVRTKHNLPVNSNAPLYTNQRLV